LRRHKREELVAVVVDNHIVGFRHKSRLMLLPERIKLGRVENAVEFSSTTTRGIHPEETSCVTCALPFSSLSFFFLNFQAERFLCIQPSCIITFYYGSLEMSCCINNKKKSQVSSVQPKNFAYVSCIIL